jgi:Flp pilus assembly protein TadG
MRRLFKHSILQGRGLRRRTEGFAAVEFALLATVLILIVSGILDFGHAWYIQQVLTNASREGARYGVAFSVDGKAARIPPSNLSPTIKDYVVNNYISQTSLASLNPIVTVSGAGYATGTKGQPVQVTVSVTKKWFILGKFISNLPTNLGATTVMLCE